MENRIKEILEAILFVSTRPLSVKRIRRRLPEFTEEEIEEGLKCLIDEYSGKGRGIEIVEVARGFQMRTKRDYAEFVKRFVRLKEEKMTKPMLETLAIIAFRQPITKGEIDRLRGVDSRATLKNLVEKGLVRMKRVEDSSTVFETTEIFLETFGLRSIEELPRDRDLEEMMIKKTFGRG